MKLLRVVLEGSKRKRGREFKYFSDEADARSWLADESPHELRMKYSREVEAVTGPTTKQELVDYLNRHHVFWQKK